MKNGFKYIVFIIVLGLVFVPTIYATQIEKSIETNSLRNYYGRTLYVGGSGSENYSRIQDAVDNASEGDSIFVFRGIYHEVVMIPLQLKLIGEARETTIIDAQKKGYTINITADSVTISGFTIQNGSYSSNLANEANLYIFSSNNNITRNIFRYSEAGIMMHTNGGNIISDNIMRNNSIGLLLSGSNNFVSKNLIIYNPDMGINAIGSMNNISGNVVTNSEIGLYFVDSGKNNISGNEISNNSIGIILTWSRTTGKNRDNVVSGNNFRNNTKGDAAFAESSGFSGRNIWRNNYWEKSRFFPKPILGFKQTRFYYPTPFGALWFFIPWFRFDWHPAQKPYNISI